MFAGQGLKYALVCSALAAYANGERHEAEWKGGLRAGSERKLYLGKTEPTESPTFYPTLNPTLSPINDIEPNPTLSPLNVSPLKSV